MRTGSAEGSRMRNFIVREITSRRLRWAGHVARMKKGRSTYKKMSLKKA